ncbi:MAG: LamG-like jellyroll fold domain-containing protein, partial [Anaerohalosphaeraceae bacterium]
MKRYMIGLVLGVMLWGTMDIVGGATVVQYNSGVSPTAGAGPAADPATQGWTFNSGTAVGNQFAAGFNSGNGGWRTVDGTSTAPAYYYQTISEKAAANMAYGWTYTVVLSMDSDAYGSAGAFVDSYYMPPNNTRQKDIYLWVETIASKTYLVQLTIDASSNLWGNDGTTNHQLTADGSAYDNFKTLTIAFDGTSAVLSCGETQVSLADRAMHGQNRVVFGATSSSDQGSAIWNSVRLDAPIIFYDDFAYGTKQGVLDYGWTEVAAGSGWGCDVPNILWGNGMVLRYITQTVIEAGSVVTIDLTFNRPWAGYVYSGDLIAWDGTTATVLGSFSIDGATVPASHTFAPIEAAYAGQLLGINYSHSANWGETSSVKLTAVLPSGEKKARLPNPAAGAADIPVAQVLSWSSPLGTIIASYDVYLDPNEAGLTAGDAEYYSSSQTALTYDPTPNLRYGQAYYWRVDAREPNNAVHTGEVWSFATLSPDPKITDQPENQLVFVGETAVFAVAAVNPFTGDDTGMSYQWYKAGAPDTAVGTNLPALTIENVQIDSKGEYYCVVSVDAPPAGVISNPVSSNAAKLLVKRLLGQWNFEDNFDDASGNGYNGTPVGTPGFMTPSDPSRAVTGKALECIVGTANYVQVPATVFDDVDTQVTFSLWTFGVNQPNAGDEHAFLAANDSGAVLASMMIPHSTARIWTRIGNPVDGTDGWYEGSSAATSWFNGKWNHWVLTKDSEAGILRVYCNGLLFLESTSAFKPFYGATKFFIGGGDAAGAFGGLIDDFRVYNYALTAEEIAAINPRPMLPSPTDGQANVMYNPALSWTPGDGTSSFMVYCGDVLDPDPNIPLTNPITVTGLSAPTTTLPVNLKLGTTYYWYVEEYDDAQQLVWTSDMWTFAVRQLVADIDDNSAVALDDLTIMAARWLDD